VKRIYNLCLEGHGVTQIARILQADRITTPSNHWVSKGIPCPAKPTENQYRWGSDIVGKILSRVEYLGHMVNFKTHKPSYKSKKMVFNPSDKFKVFEDTHEAIVEADVWERVQELRKNKRRPTRTGRTHMFSGIAHCADCKGKMYYGSDRGSFVCSTSQKRTGGECTTHYIRAVVLEQGVLAHMRLVMSFVACYGDLFRQIMGARHKAEVNRELTQKRKAYNKAGQRIMELDRLFKRIYEDFANDILSEGRFKMLSDGYEKEQEELRGKLLQLETEIKTQEEQTDNLERFIGKAKRYLDLDELTPIILNDMVKAVYVHKAVYEDGKRVQEIDISYDLVGILPSNIQSYVEDEKTA